MLNRKVEIFDKLANIFNKNNYHLYMIGGLSRDFLLNERLTDYDFVSDATPKEITKFLDNIDLTFAKYGTIKYKIDDISVDIVTLRKEENYKDFRHPSKIEFIKDINIDYLRRDFTINAIYIDESYKILDPSKQGIKDLNDKILRFIGNPLERIKEDPLRILRAYRFIKKYNLSCDESTYKILKENRYLLNELNKDKILQEIKKGGLEDEIF